jgi:VWFA-related protein
MKYAVAIAAAAILIVSMSSAQSPKPPSPQSAAPAQPPTPTQSDEKTDITIEVSRVQLLFTVSDKKGRFVTNLSKDDFEIFETKKPQSIVEFNAETNLPLRLAILIDTSNSIRDRFKFQQEAATDFVNTVIREHEDKAVIVSFDTAAELVADMTDDTEKLGKAIHGLRPGGGTALYDAVFFACRDKLLQDQPKFKYRHAMVIISDGDDNQSRWTREQALEMAHKADTVIYAISTNRSGIEGDGDKVLRYFADQTGGQVFFPFKAQDLSQDFENIANELRHQYNVLYRPEPLKADGLYHPVDVKVRNRKDLVVRARHGYYAPSM